MCPHCEQPLVVYEMDGIEIDHCLSCSGTWLDAGELELFSELSGFSAGGITRALADPSAGRSDRRCARCRRHLEILHVDPGDGEAGRIEIDRCPVGHGLWFDQGEIVSLIRVFDSGAEDGTGTREECVVAKFFANLYQDELS